MIVVVVVAVVRVVVVRMVVIVVNVPHQSVLVAVKCRTGR
jgi:hypothetical protein